MDPSESAPSEAPSIERRLRFNPLQLVGVPLVMVVPILALLGVLGETRERRTSRENGVSIDVEFAACDHYEAPNRIRLRVHTSSRWRPPASSSIARWWTASPGSNSIRRSTASITARIRCSSASCRPLRSASSPATTAPRRAGGCAGRRASPRGGSRWRR